MNKTLNKNTGNDGAGTSQVLSTRRPTPANLDPWQAFWSEPFSLLRNLSAEFDQLFSGPAGHRRMAPAGGDSTNASPWWSPAMEMVEQDGHVLIRAELPGLKKEDVQIELVENRLVLQGERKHEQEAKEGGMYRSERSYGRFYRALQLPAGVDAENITATCQDGVLEIKVPVTQPQQQTRRIEIA